MLPIQQTLKNKFLLVRQVGVTYRDLMSEYGAPPWLSKLIDPKSLDLNYEPSDRLRANGDCEIASLFMQYPIHGEPVGI